MTVVVFTGVRNIFAKPYGWIITERLFFRRKFHFCEIESFIRSIKYIQFNGESIFFRDKIAGFGNEDSVSFWTHMFIGFFGKWKIIFLAGHKTFGFIGKIVVIILFADAGVPS